MTFTVVVDRTQGVGLALARTWERCLSVDAPGWGVVGVRQLGGGGLRRQLRAGRSWGLGSKELQLRTGAAPKTRYVGVAARGGGMGDTFTACSNERVSSRASAEKAWGLADG